MKKYYIEANSEKFLNSLDNNLTAMSKFAHGKETNKNRKQIEKSKKIYIDIFYKFIKN